MRKVMQNIWIDLLSLLSLLGLLGSGIVMYLVLPPGSRLPPGTPRGGREFWGLDRHEWGDWHFYIAVAFCALILLHLVLHLPWIKAAAKMLRPQRSTTPRVEPS